MEFVIKCEHCGEYYRQANDEQGAVSCLCDHPNSGRQTLPRVGDVSLDWIACPKGRHRVRKPGTHYYSRGVLVHVTLLQGRFCKWCNREVLSLPDRIRAIKLESAA